MTRRITFADDALLDTLKFLDRYTLDAVRLASRRFDGLVDAMKDACLRNIYYAAIVQPLRGNHNGRYILRAGVRPGLGSTGHASRFELDVAEADVVEVFGSIVRYAYVERLGVYDVACTDGLFFAIRSVLPTAWVNKWFFKRNDLRSLTPAVFIDAVLSPASISTMSIARNRNGSLSHINDRLLMGLARKGATEVLVDDEAGILCDPCGVSDRGVFRFLTTGPTKKRLRIQKPQLSASFFEQLHEAIEGGQISAGSELAIYKYGPLNRSVFAQYSFEERHEGIRTYQMGSVAKVTFNDWCEQEIVEVIFSEE